MNKSLYLTHWLVVIALILSILAAMQTGLALWQATKTNHFIKQPSKFEQVPDNENALFAQAFYDVQQGDTQQAMDDLTQLISTDNIELKASAYYNRGNINLRQAMTMDDDDIKRIPLVELAKQDYRTALLMMPNLWNVRFNLELALIMVPEQPDIDALFDKPEVFNRVSRRTQGFKVDLP